MTHQSLGAKMARHLSIAEGESRGTGCKLSVLLAVWVAGTDDRGAGWTEDAGSACGGAIILSGPGRV